VPPPGLELAIATVAAAVAAAGEVTLDVVEVLRFEKTLRIFIGVCLFNKLLLLLQGEF
jgi:hypothetical protein